MLLCKRLVALLVLFLSSIGLLVGLAGIAGVWVVRQKVTGGVDHLFAKTEEALQFTSRGISKGETFLADSQKDLKKVQAVVVVLQSGVVQLPGMQALVKTTYKKLKPNLEQVQGQLLAAKDSALVLNKLLELLKEIPLSETPRLQEERLEKWSERLQTLATATQELHDALENEQFLFDGKLLKKVQASLAKVEQILEDVRHVVNEIKEGIAEAGTETQELHQHLHSWIGGIAIVLTIVLLWIAFSQGNLLLSSTRWMKGRTQEPTGAGSGI